MKIRAIYRLSFIVPALIALAMLLLTATAYISILSISKEQVSSRVKALLLRRVNFAQTTFERSAEQGDTITIDRFISTTSASPDILNIVLVDKNGIVVASNNYAEKNRPVTSLPLTINSHLVELAKRTRSLQLAEEDQQALAVYAPVCIRGDKDTIRAQSCGFFIYRISLAYDLTSNRALLLSQFTLTAAIILLIGAALAIALNRLITKPAQGLVRAANAYLVGHRDVRLNFKGNNELSTIGHALDGMLNQLAIEETHLKESREQYRRLLESTPIACVLLSKDKVQFANRAFSKLYALDEPVSGDFSKFAQVTKVLRGGSTLDFYTLYSNLGPGEQDLSSDVIISAMDGSIVRAIAYVMRLDAKSGDILISFANVTERERARELIQLHSQVWEQSSDLLIVADLDGCIKDANPATSRLLGLNSTELIGKKLLEVMGQRPSIEETQRRRKLADETGSLTTEYLVRLANDRQVKLLSTLLPLRDSAGQITARLVILRDMTKEDERLSALRRFSNLVAAAPDPIIGIDRFSKLMLCNPAACKAFGYAEKDLLGRSLTVLLPESIANPHGDWVDAFFNSPDSSRSMAQLRTITGVRSDGQQLKLQISLARTEDLSGNMTAIAVIRDVTALESMRSQLQQADKLSALGQLTGGIAHDFNNLLAVMMSSAEMIAISTSPQTSNHTLSNRIVAMANRGADLIRRLMVFSRKADITPEDIDIAAVIRETIDTLERTLGSSIKVDFDVGPRPMYVSVDRSMLVSCLLNLSVNARDAMPDGGTLSFTISSQNDQSLSSSKSWVVLTVADSGLGIPEDIRDRIFEPFFTTKSSTTGTGLGLAMVYGFIKQSGGEIEVFSEVGEGSRFVLRFPRLLLPEASNEQKMDIFDNARPGGGAIILLVEDDVDVRESMTVQLEHLGCEVIAAETLEQAQSLVEQHTDIMAVICDYEIGGGRTGVELAEWIKSKGYRIPGAIVSGYVKSSGERISSLGWRRLQKPVPIAELNNLLKDLLSPGSDHQISSKESIV